MPEPILPNVTRAEYDAQRGVDVRKSYPRRVFIDRKPFRLIAEDWPTAEHTDAAALLACMSIWHGHATDDTSLDDLADKIARQIGADLTRPYGMALLLEPATE